MVGAGAGAGGGNVYRGLVIVVVGDGSKDDREQTKQFVRSE